MRAPGDGLEPPATVSTSSRGSKNYEYPPVKLPGLRCQGPRPSGAATMRADPQPRCRYCCHMQSLRGWYLCRPPPTRPVPPTGTPHARRAQRARPTHVVPRRREGGGCSQPGRLYASVVMWQILLCLLRWAGRGQARQKGNVQLLRCARARAAHRSPGGRGQKSVAAVVRPAGTRPARGAQPRLVGRRGRPVARRGQQQSCCCRCRGCQAKGLEGMWFAHPARPHSLVPGARATQAPLMAVVFTNLI